MKLNSTNNLHSFSLYARGAAALILLASASTSFAAPVYDSVTAAAGIAIGGLAGAEQRNAKRYEWFHQPQYNVTDGLDDYSEQLHVGEKPPIASDNSTSEPNVTTTVTTAASGSLTILAISSKKDPIATPAWFRQPHLHGSDELDDYGEDYRWTHAYAEPRIGPTLNYPTLVNLAP